ncbi:uncharacterized protein LOC119786480 isoform X3 [Cyprinodon tularosa]|uniref:uncharacterized protein LOC119786480 isoform X3 n=1 Tax=Cyprinodon tularosa TaxID=77115 RepID=UPI0018E282C3|nr:uncharacterized protein LOC119786480 isoform X3 [Cyprinodon tularosa]
METTRRNAPNVKEHKERKFAVVRWSEGEDAGKLSEVKTDNIRRYDDSNMDQHGNPISTYSAIVEWRHGKKQRGGWPHYMGTVVFVCATRFEAARKRNALLRENEPADLTKRAPVHPKNYQDDSDDSDPDDTQILSQPLQVKKSKALTRKDPAEEFLAMYSHSPLSVTDCDQSPKKTVVELKREIQDLKEENAKLRELLVEDVPELMKTMKNVIGLAEPLKRSSFELPQSSTQSRPGSSPDDSQMPIPESAPSVSSESVTPSTRESQSSKVEIHPGTGVMIEKLAWAYAINANSATVFVRHLLTAVFPTETLLVQLLRSGLGPNPPALVSQSMPRSQNSEPKVKMSLSQNPLRWLVCHTLCEDIDCHTVSGQVFINPLFCPS